MLEALERFKQLGMYGVTLYYGEDIGCDDSDLGPEERRLILLAYPVGCLGEVKLIWVGTVEEFLVANLKARPEVVTNPPPKDITNKPGYYITGTERGVERILQEPFFGSWED